ncbi:MAG: DUF5681 domain-containing protein [Pseudomonadota bacterium]
MTSKPETTGRDEAGRFRKGVSGNPAGRPPGARHHTTRAMEALLEGQAEALTQTAVDSALAGDTAALRLCFERLMPPRKDAPITVDLPPMKSAADAAEAMASVVAQAAAGEITPGEAATMASLIETYRKTLETTDFEARLKALEDRR